MTPARALAALLALSTTLACLPAAAQEQTTITYTSVLGDIEHTRTPNRGRIHVGGNVGAETADYFRGVFDDVPEGLDEIAVGPDLSVIVELWRGGQADWLQNLTLTVGTQNNLADQVQPVDSSVRDWYESNNFVGLGARLAGDWLLGVIYTVYTSPNDVSPTAEEVAVAGSYRGDNFLGRLAPQLKVAKRVDPDRGVYTELRLTPSLTLFEGAAYPLTLRAPLTLGVGFDDYYAGEDVAGFIGVGLNGSIPLAFIPSDYGVWRFTGGVEIFIRDDELRRQDGPFGSRDTAVVIGSVSISFVY